MTDITYLYDWLDQYIKTFYTEDNFVMERVLLKQVHSRRVAENTVRLADKLQLTARQRTLAEVIGLFHDIARFRQITEYRTFVDAESFDHGDIGAGILVTSGILQDFSPGEQAAITFAIKAHNKMVIPLTNAENELYAKIIRDADKLDILRILPPIKADHNYSPRMIEQLKVGGVLSYRDVRTLADKRLIRLSWFYDINFNWTLQQLVDEGQVERQLAALPDSPEFQIIRQTARNYITHRLCR